MQINMKLKNSPSSTYSTPMPKLGMSVDNIVSKLFYLHTTAHFYHLQTTSFAQHKMLDDLYKDLQEVKDSICEHLLGLQAPARFGVLTHEQCEPFSDVTLQEFLECGVHCGMSICSFAKDRGQEGLCNLAAELIELFVKAKYLNTLK